MKSKQKYFSQEYAFCNADKSLDFKIPTPPPVFLYLLHDWLEDKLVGHIVHSLLKRYIYTIASSTARPGLIHVPGPREEIPVFMKRNGHHTIRQIKRFLENKKRIRDELKK